MFGLFVSAVWARKRINSPFVSAKNIIFLRLIIKRKKANMHKYIGEIVDSQWTRESVWACMFTLTYSL